MTTQYPQQTWNPHKASPAQIQAAHFLAHRLQNLFDPGHHESVWDLPSSALQDAWYRLALENFPLYLETHKTASEVQTLATDILKSNIQT